MLDQPVQLQLLTSIYDTEYRANSIHASTQYSYIMKILAYSTEW